MADSRALLSGLDEYQKLLERHLIDLQVEFDLLNHVWHGFDTVYEGDAADQFRVGWSRTNQRFIEYINATHKINTMLQERIEALREANQTEDGLGL